MRVFFKTQQGRTLYLEREDGAMGVVTAINTIGVLAGLELGGDGTVFYVNGRHIVEWWEQPTDIGAA